MQKRLITKDYEKIVFESFKISETDLHNYYLNIIEEKYHYNKDIVSKLKESVNNYLNCYYSEIYGKSITVTFEDGSKEVVNENQTWYEDKNGKRIPIPLENKLIPLLLKFGIYKHVNKSFFDNQLKELNRIQEIIDFKKSTIEFESMISKYAKLEEPISVGFDYEEIRERYQKLKKLVDEETIQTIISNDIKLKTKEWFFNDRNILKLNDGAIALSIIGIGLMKQIALDKCNTLSDFLNKEIELDKEIAGTGGYTIHKILLQEFKIRKIFTQKNNKIEVAYLYNLIQNWLLSNFLEDKNSEIISLDEYKEIFISKQNKFLISNIDTTTNDFIKTEIKTCKKIINELKKPIYNNITLLGLEDKSSEFKKNLKNSIKRRLEFLKNKIECELTNVNTSKMSVKNIEVEELNIFCKTMQLDIPRNHFKILTTNKSKNGHPFLTDKQLEDFIQKAFLGKELPKQIINFADGEKLLVQSVFYEFYSNNCFDYFGTLQKQNIFIELLTNNFKGWDFEKLKGNFKPKTNKRLP